MSTKYNIALTGNFKEVVRCQTFGSYQHEELAFDVTFFAPISITEAAIKNLRHSPLYIFLNIPSQ